MASRNTVPYEESVRPEDALLKKTVYRAIGGFGNMLLAELAQTYAPGKVLPAGTAALGIDTCGMNPWSGMTDRGQVLYEELPFEAPAAAVDEMVAQNPHWAPSLLRERLRLTRQLRFATSGTLKHRSRALAVALFHRHKLDDLFAAAWSDLANGDTSFLDSSISEVFHLVGYCGGTGDPLEQFAHLREHARGVPHGQTRWCETHGLGPDFYEENRDGLMDVYRVNFGLAMRLTSRLNLGIKPNDPFFDDIPPGLEDLVAPEQGAGSGVLHEGAWDMRVVYNKRNMKGGQHNLQGITRMIAACLHHRSRIPALSTAIHDMVTTRRDQNAEAEMEDHTSRFVGGVGGSFIEMNPRVSEASGAVQQHLLAQRLLLGNALEDSDPEVGFNLNRLEEEAADWRSEMHQYRGLGNDYPLRLSTRESLGNLISANPRPAISTAIARIKALEESTRLCLDERGLKEEAGTRLKGELAQAVQAAKRTFGLKASQAPIQNLRQELSAVAQATVDRLPDGWDGQVWAIAEPMIPSEVAPETGADQINPQNIGFVRAIFLNLSARLLERINRAKQPQAARQSRRSGVSGHPNFNQVVAGLLKHEETERNRLIRERQIQLAAELVQYLDSQIVAMEQQSFAAAQVAKEALATAQSILGPVDHEDKVVYVVQPAMEFLQNHAAVSPALVNEAWERVDAGSAIKEATIFPAVAAWSFKDLIEVDAENIKKWLKWRLRETGPHIAINPDQAGDVPQMSFFICPKDLQPLFNSFKLGFSGPLYQDTIVPPEAYPVVGIYAMAYCLHPRQSASVADCEEAVRVATDAQRYERSLWPTLRNLPSHFYGDWDVTEEVFVAASTVNPEVQAADVFHVRVNGLDVVGKAPVPTDPRPILQDQERNYHVRVTVEGGKEHIRPLGTDDHDKAVTAINQAKGKYQDPLERYLIEAVGKDRGYLLDGVLKETVRQLGVWIEEWEIRLEDTDWDKLKPAEQEEFSRVRANMPAVQKRYLALERLADSNWVERYRRVKAGQTIDLADYRRRLRARRA